MSERVKTGADKRQYSEQEARFVFERAAELQKKEVVAAGTLSQAEIRHIAQEAGLDALQVERALAELESKNNPATQSASKRWFGESTRLNLTREIEGEIPPEAFESMAEACRKQMGAPLHIQTLGRTMTLTLSDQHHSNMELEITVRVRDGKTQISIEKRFGGLAGGLFGGIGGGVGGGVGIPLSVLALTEHSLTAAIASGAAMVGSYVLARTIYVGVNRHQRRKAEALMEKLVAFAEEQVKPH
jgi:hypothetical protein